MASPDPIAITGLGAVSAAGVGCGALWEAMRDGIDLIGPITRFPTHGDQDACGGLVPGFDEPPLSLEADGRPQELAVRFGRDAIDEACAQAGLPPQARRRAALVVGSNLEDRPELVYTLTARLAEACGIDGPRLTVSVACASSALALGAAIDLLDEGLADVVIAGGSDVVTPRMLAGFRTLRALAPQRCSPFGGPPGMSLGDGAGFLILERLPHAKARGVRVLATLGGFGAASDAHHPTRPVPDGRGIAAAISAALRHAGVAPDQIDYVNAHGTGTEANDAAEWRGVRSGLLDHQPPISSTKSLLGHTQGAAGALELVATLLCREHGAAPPTRSLEGPRPGAPPEPLFGHTPRPLPWRTALCTNAAFGGVNTALIVHHDEAPPRAVEHAPVWLIGLGQTTQETTGRADLPTLARDLLRVDPRQMDPTTLLLTIAVQRALADAGLRATRATRDGLGLFTGQSRVSPATLANIQRAIDADGPGAMSAADFVRSVLISPTGAVTQALDLRGPSAVFASGRAAGLHAVAHAFWNLRREESLHSLVVATVDEAEHPKRVKEGSPVWEGAVALTLSRRPPPHAACRLVGVHLGPPDRSAADELLDRLGWQDTDLHTIVGAPPLLQGEPDHPLASEGLLAVLHAAQALGAGTHRRALVELTDGATLAVAIALSWEGRLDVA